MHMSSQQLQLVSFLLAGILIFAASWLLAKILSDLVRRRLTAYVHLPRADLAGRVIYVGLILIGAFIGLSFALQNSGVAITGILVATILASLGVQDLLRNYVSGFYLLIERQIQVGDVISFDSNAGRVVDVGLRVSVLEGEEGSRIIVPNTELFNKPVTIRRQEPKPEPQPQPPPRRRATRGRRG
jgi:small-conductance mechanosensitive channel